MAGSELEASQQRKQLTFGRAESVFFMCMQVVYQIITLGCLPQLP